MTESVRELKELEERSDRMAFEITQYLVFCASSELSRKRFNEVTVLLRVVAELEETGDCAYQLVRLAKRKYRKNQVMPTATQDAIRDFCGHVDQFISFYIDNLDAAVETSDMETALQLENTIATSRKKLRKKAVRRMRDPANIKSEMLYIEILNQIERIGDHSLNILQLLNQKD